MRLSLEHLLYFLGTTPNLSKAIEFIFQKWKSSVKVGVYFDTFYFWVLKVGVVSYLIKNVLKKFQKV